MISSIDPFKILISINPWTKVSKAILCTEDNVEPGFTELIAFCCASKTIS